MKTHFSMIGLEKSEKKSKSVTKKMRKIFWENLIFTIFTIFCVIFMCRETYSMLEGDLRSQRVSHRTDPEEVEVDGQ
jgi:hypothetical protein